jgi:hypothetical protein
VNAASFPAMPRLRSRVAPAECLAEVPLGMLLPAFASNAPGKSLIMKVEKFRFESEMTDGFNPKMFFAPNMPLPSGFPVDRVQAQTMVTRDRWG